MANITEYLNNIKAAVYGEEVRGSIHDAIQVINSEAAEAKEAAITAQDSAQNSAAQAAASAAQAASTFETATEAIETAKTAAITDVDTAKTAAIADVNSTKTAAEEVLNGYKTAAKESVDAAKISEERAQEYAQDVVDQILDIGNLDPADGIDETDLFIISKSGVNKTLTGRQILDALSADKEYEDAVIEINENTITQTTDSGTVVTTITKVNGSDVITTTETPNDGDYIYVTTTTISGDRIQVTHSTERKE